MTSWFSAVDAKILAMRNYCLDQCVVDCDHEHVEDSQLAYNQQFDDLVAAINGYKTNTTKKESQMIDIIMMDFTNTIISEINYNPPIFKPIGPFPTGYNDYWDLYKMAGFVDFILSASNSYFYEDCIIAPDTTTPKLQAAIADAVGAEAADTALRDAVTTYVRLYPMLNALIYLTENFSISGAPKSKTEVGNIIYLNKHAKEIIQSFGLEVYIPSYV